MTLPIPHRMEDAMSETMLEKAARAAVTAEQDQWDLPAEEWDFETLERHGLIKIARAVLMAVRSETCNSEVVSFLDGVIGEQNS